MIICKTKQALQTVLQLQNNPISSGFVPTMGALHNGHLALIDASKKAGNYTVSSIFVNPTQFNIKEDFDKYPISIEADINLLIQHQCDVLFFPTVEEMYTDGPKIPHHYPLNYLEQILEGEYRTGHFQDVCYIVEQLLKLVTPTHLYMGSKDYQQCMVIQFLLQYNLQLSNIQLHIEPTVREANGLAVSSRNRSLSTENFNKAATIFQTLVFIKQNIGQYSLDALINMAKTKLIEGGFEKNDYISIADAHMLKPIEQFNRQQPAIVLAAAFLQNVRLIDNLPLN
jgi:pantoate--beta-alanine ligase